MLMILNAFVLCMGSTFFVYFIHVSMSNFMIRCKSHKFCLYDKCVCVAYVRTQKLHSVNSSMKLVAATIWYEALCTKNKAYKYEVLLDY